MTANKILIVDDELEMCLSTVELPDEVLLLPGHRLAEKRITLETRFQATRIA